MTTNHDRTAPANAAVVLGCGLMGADISAIFVHAGWRVIAMEPNRDTWDHAMRRVAASVEQLGACERPGAFTLRAALPDIDWTDVRLVVECAPENLALKQALFAQLDHVVPEHIPIGSNSSGLPISAITRDCTTASRMANAHFFLPAHLVPLVELAKGARTSDETIRQLRALFQSVGRVAVQIEQDLPGFLANRIQHALMREAFSLIDRGLATPEDVDAAVRFGFGFRYLAAGPILQKELSGLETQLAAATAIYPSLCNDATPSAGLARRVQAGALGTKTLQGYWRWTREAADATRRRFEATLVAAGKLLRADPPAHDGRPPSA